MKWSIEKEYLFVKNEKKRERYTPEPEHPCLWLGGKMVEWDKIWRCVTPNNAMFSNGPGLTVEKERERKNHIIYDTKTSLVFCLW